jgi:hypothetical protein
VPAHAELSRWAAESALQQEEPEVKSVTLAKALLDVYIRFCGEERCAVCWMCMCRSYPLLTAKCCVCAVCWLYMCRCSRDGPCRLLYLLCMRHRALWLPASAARQCSAIGHACLFVPTASAMSAQCSIFSAFATCAQCVELLCARLVQGRMT